MVTSSVPYIFDIVCTNTLWAFVIRGTSGVSVPSKYFLRVATPELIHSNVGSFTGIKLALGWTLCPFLGRNQGTFDEFRYLIIFSSSFSFFVIKTAPFYMSHRVYQFLPYNETAVHSSLIPITLEGRLYFYKVFNRGARFWWLFSPDKPLNMKISTDCLPLEVYEKRLVLSTIRMSFFFNGRCKYTFVYALGLRFNFHRKASSEKERQSFFDILILTHQVLCNLVCIFFDSYPIIRNTNIYKSISLDTVIVIFPGRSWLFNSMIDCISYDILQNDFEAWYQEYHQVRIVIFQTYSISFLFE